MGHTNALLKDGVEKTITKSISNLVKKVMTGSDKLYGLVGDDSLFDDLYVGVKNPNGDARPLVRKHEEIRYQRRS